MAVELEGLEFQIEAQSDKASKGIDALTKSLGQLKNALKGNSMGTTAKNLTTLSNAVEKLHPDKLDSLSNAVTSLTNAKISATIPKRISEIGAALDSITLNGVENLEDTARALERISAVGKISVPNVSSVTNPGATPTNPSGAVDSEVEDVASKTEKATFSFSKFKAMLNEVAQAGGKAGAAIKAVTGTLKVLKTVGSGATKALKLAGSGFKALGQTIGSKISSKVKSVTSSFGGLFSSLKRIAMYRAIRFFFSQLSQAMKDGINNLYQYSALMGGQFKNSMDSLATSFLYLKNSMGAMVSPLINAIAPAVQYLIDKFVALLNVINQVFARLTGATTFTRAKKSVTEYAETAAGSAKKAAKEIKNATTGIDELNIIDQKDDDNSGGGASTPNYADMFEKVPIDKSISDFVDKLKAAFNAGDWKTLGTLLGEKFNEIVDSIDWDGIGHKVGYYLNGAIQTAYWFLKTADFKNLGKHVAEMMNAALSEIDGEYIGRLFVRWYTAGLDFLIGFLGKLDWHLVGKTIGDALKGAFNEAQEWIASYDWSKMAHEVYKNLKNFLTGLDFKGIAKSFFKLLGSALAAAVSFIATFISDIWKDIKKYFSKYIDTDGKEGFWEVGKEVVAGIFKGIVDAIKGIGKWIKENIFDPFIEGFKECFGIHSPSKVMAEQGRYIVEGLINGISEKISACIAKVKEWAGKIVEWFTKGEDGKGIIEHFKEIGGNIVSNFKEKIGNTYTTVKTNVTTWASKVKDWFTNSSFGGVNSTTFTNYANTIITGFREKVGNTYSTVKTNVTTWASKVREWFTSSSFGGVNSDNWQTFANNTIEGFKSKIGSAYTNTKSNIITWATNLKSWFTDNGYGGINNTNWQTFANNVIEGFKTKIGSAYTNTKSNIITWCTNLKSWFTDSSYGGVNNSNWQTYANNVIEGFKTKIGNAYTNTKSNMTTWATNVKSWFSDIASKSAFEGFATNVVDGFKNKVGSYYTTAKRNLNTFGQAVKGWFEKPYENSDTTIKDKFVEIGKNIIQGFIDGVNSLWNTAMEKIKNFGKSVISKGKEGTEEHSPSKAFKQIGAYVIEGFNIGLNSNMASTFQVMNTWLKGINSFAPSVAMGVDTSALKYYDSSAFARNISANVQTNTEFGASGYYDAMEDFYREYVQPTLTQMATDIRRQADKEEKTVVQVGNRVITDAVTTQQKANGYRFT